MSSRLAPDLLAEFHARHRSPDGTYRCAGYQRRAHGRYLKSHIHIDHIKPEVDFPELAFDVDNLQPLCAPPGGGGCHRAKTSDEARTRARMAARRRRRPAAAMAGIAVYLCLLALSTGLLAYAVALGTGDQASADRLEQLGRDAATVLIVAASAAILVWAAWQWWKAGEQDKKPSKPAAQGPEDATRARLLEAARESLGARGTVEIKRMEWRR